MSDISPSRLGEKADAEFEKLVSEATSADQIKSLYAEKAVREGLVVRDIYDPSVLLVNDAAAPTKFTKTIKVDGGTKLLFEGDNEIELEENISDYFRALAPHEPAEKADAPHETPRDASGRFISENEVVAKAELELKFKRGEIDTAEYLAQSGAVDDYLKSQGVSIDELKASVEQTRNENRENSWKQVTQEFLSSPEGADWPGGEANVKIASRLLEENGLVDSPSVENLAAVYRHMKENGLVVENPELVRATKISEAKSFSEVQAALGSRGSGLFDR
jgi:hypothetical protein